MMVLVTGGSKCGKSHYAESLFENCSEQKFYIATMRPFGNEAYSAIYRHQKMRENKGFLTIEKYTDIDQADITFGCAALIECMNNLLANEMFIEDKMIDCSDKIVNGIMRLYNKTKLLVIVTNQVGCDALKYETGTAAYISALGKINQHLAEYADRVIECVYGIPVIIKG